jgi:hypothetical protein
MIFCAGNVAAVKKINSWSLFSWRSASSLLVSYLTRTAFLFKWREMPSGAKNMFRSVGPAQTEGALRMSSRTVVIALMKEEDR